jgi:hypothetical protein
MNRHQSKVRKFTVPFWFMPFVKITTRKNPVKIGQLVLVSRIIILFVTIGLIGYSLDWLKEVLKKPPSLG